ncbi:hypothetical protein INT43_005620 [Umbelopsis isabellina]|uniref:Chaps-domain-containing protein n=1 Tax=Mortierella isabellina TaxID=91625 RepID=A0A8H7PNG3_MORIS|nr:hypothetical protein INT43_005620 [Umbelopsis isabellina]
MSEFLKEIPEFFENTLGECIAARTDQLGAFRELGPPDLCHIVKTNVKPGQKEASFRVPNRCTNVKQVGSYHYVSGVDASSSASIAAYLNSLTYAIDDNAAWFGKGEFKIRGATYCCYNAFSRVDIRVEVKIPGGVESYYIDARGERHEATNQIWLETYLSACTRAILFSDDGNYRIAGYRKLDPISNVNGEVRYLEAVHALFDKGWMLGSDPEVQTSTVAKNHLSDALMKFFAYGANNEPLIDLLERLYGNDPEVGALLAKAYINSDQEVKAVHLLYKTLQIAPTKYTVLHTQIDFLLEKHAFEQALKLAKFSVKSMPSEFLTWSKLALVYIELGEFKTALLALNSCPMFTYSERDQHRMIPPARTHLPIKQSLLESNLLEPEVRDPDSDPNLLRLPAAALHGTFRQAYDLLTKLAAKVGWDELLHARSEVFVMEEEYRKAKEAEETKRKSVTLEAIKQVQIRRHSTLEGTEDNAEKDLKAEKDDEPKTDNTIDETEINDQMAELTTEASIEAPTVESNDQDAAQGVGSFIANTKDVAAPTEEEINIAQPEADQEISLDSPKGEGNTEVELETNGTEVLPEVNAAADEGAENDESTEDTPSGAQTPSSLNENDEKQGATAGSKNSKKNQKKKKNKKNKNKKAVIDNVTEFEEPPRQSTEEPTIVVPEPQQELLTETEATVADVLKDDELAKSDEFTEVDISGNAPIDNDTTEAVNSNGNGHALSTEEIQEPVPTETSLEDEGPADNTSALEPPKVNDVEPAHLTQTPTDPTSQPLVDDEKLTEKDVTAEPHSTEDKNEQSGTFMELNLKHKRLCERWLDNLFIVLYEDLRQYTVWRTEVQHYRAQQVEYHKNPTEWEILGDLATRLCHEPEAKEAYQNCLKERFSPRAWTRLLDIYADEGDMKNALQAAVKLTVYHNRWYNEMTNPTHISLNINKIIRKHGVQKTQNSLTSMNLTEPVLRLMNKYFENAATFKVDGYDF